MKTKNSYIKIFGNFSKNHIAFMFSPTLWFFGFGWSYYPPGILNANFNIHFYFGPINLMFSYQK